jgi:hypothetical protein
MRRSSATAFRRLSCSLMRTNPVTSSTRWTMYASTLVLKLVHEMADAHSHGGDPSEPGTTAALSDG